jgi:hypothetical protein
MISFVEKVVVQKRWGSPLSPSCPNEASTNHRHMRSTLIQFLQISIFLGAEWPSFDHQTWQEMPQQMVVLAGQ